MAKTLIKIPFYRIRCSYCSAIFEFEYCDVERDEYNPNERVINCPNCKKNIRICEDKKLKIRLIYKKERKQ